MRILSWNLQKKGLSKWVIETYAPDVALFQEYWQKVNPPIAGHFQMTESFKKKKSPCGTAILSNFAPAKTFGVKTTEKEFVIGVQKTCVGGLYNGVYFVSLHAFNGWPFRSPARLANCLKDFIAPLEDIKEPCVVSGDFNTFTDRHLKEVDSIMATQGFTRQISVAYDDKKSLDHVFTRGVDAKLITKGYDQSDHPYFLFEL